MRRGFSSIGFSRAAARSRCKNITTFTARSAELPASRYPQRYARAGEPYYTRKKYFDVSDPKYADMTPMFNLIKDIVKAREERREEASRC